MKIFFQKNSEKEEKFKAFINVKKKTFKKAVDRNRIKRRAKVILREIILLKNKKLEEKPEKFINKNKIIVVYDFEKEDLTLKFEKFKEKITSLFNKQKMTFLLFFLSFFLFYSHINSDNCFSSKIKNSNILAVYCKGKAFQKIGKIKNENSFFEYSAPKTDFEAERKKMLQRKENIQNQKQNEQPLNLSNAFFNYEYREFKDGDFELENGNIISKQGEDFTVKYSKFYIKNRQNIFDDFFYEKNKDCNYAKFYFIYENLIKQKPFFGYYYQIYIPFYFDNILIYLIKEEDSNYIYHLITSRNNDFACLCSDAKFFDYNYIKAFEENLQKQKEIIKKKDIQRKNLGSSKANVNMNLLSKKDLTLLQNEINFKTAFNKLNNNLFEIIKKDEDLKNEFLDDVNTFDLESFAYFLKNFTEKKKISPHFLFEIVDCFKIKIIDKEILKKFKLLKL